MRGLRRAALALGIGSLMALVLRLRRPGGSPPRTGGWRELDDADLAPLAPLDRLRPADSPEG